MIKKITFEQVYPIWHDHLWLGRVSEIKPTNGIKFMGGFDKSIENNEPTFFGAFIGDDCVGVNSGFKTDENYYRCRGLYVKPNHRKTGISQTLLYATQGQAYAEKCGFIWSMPRESALAAYERFGFKKVSDMFEEMEFGPNCFVLKTLGGLKWNKK